MGKNIITNLNEWEKSNESPKDKNGDDLEIDDQVSVPDPDEDDIWNNSFDGFIVKFDGEYVVVEDGEGDCFSVEPNRLELVK